MACWAHARRSRARPDQSPITLQALEKIGAIFATERGINGQSAEVRRVVRQAQSVPLLADLKAYLETSLTRISGKSDLAKAIRYGLNRWEALCRFTEDGRLEMTSNAAERAIRPLTLGRRNWTFLGFDAGDARDCFHPDPELQAQWREPRGLSRRSDRPGRRSSGEPPRRALALELEPPGRLSCAHVQVRRRAENHARPCRAQSHATHPRHGHRAIIVGSRKTKPLL